MLNLRISTDSGAPIWRQITDQVRWGAANGAAAPGDALPSVRALADRLVVNPNTVARAYAELVREGILEARPGKGYTIAERRQLYSRPERQRRLQEMLESFARESLILGFTPDEIRRALDRTLNRLDGGAS
jgi:GntR family transcriptional regulator